MKTPATRQYELFRKPFFRMPGGLPGVTMERHPSDPDDCSKTVTAESRDDLLAKAQAFGNEYGKACWVSMKPLAGRGFRQTPDRIRCHEDDVPEYPEQR